MRRSAAGQKPGSGKPRRASQKPPSEGGWNLFFTNWAVPDVMNPIANVMLNGKGKSGGWFGWPKDDEMEALLDKFVRAKTPEEQKAIAADIQKRAYDQVTYMHLGQYTGPSAWRTSLKGVLDGPATPVFWNIEKTEE